MLPESADFEPTEMPVNVMDPLLQHKPIPKKEKKNGLRKGLRRQRPAKTPPTIASEIEDAEPVAKESVEDINLAFEKEFMTVPPSITDVLMVEVENVVHNPYKTTGEVKVCKLLKFTKCEDLLNMQDENIVLIYGIL